MSTKKLFPVPDLSELYYNTFKKVAAWAHSTGGLLTQVSWYLQGLQLLETDFEVVDSYNRCKILAEKVRNMKNGTELMSWIHHTVSDDEICSSAIARASLIAPSEFRGKYEYNGIAESYIKLSGRIGSSLWTLWQGNSPPVGVQTALQIVKTSDIKAPSIIIDLKAHEGDEGWFIAPSIDTRLEGSPTQQRAAMGLLALESLRQQLDEKKGIYCPHYRPGRCKCESSGEKFCIVAYSGLERVGLAMESGGICHLSAALESRRN
jgi:hypothetical protein